MNEKEQINELFRQIKDGDMSKFQQFYLLTNKSLYFTIYVIFKDDHISKDLLQEVYIDFLNYKDKLKNNVDIMAYLVSASKNKAINYYHKRKKEHEFTFKYLNESYSLDEKIDSGLLDQIKAILDEKEYMVFILKVLGEYTFKEISKLKNIPIGTLTWLYSQAKEKLQTKLGGYQ